MLLSKNRWSNSVDFVSFNYKGKTLDNISIGIWNNTEAKVDVQTLSIKKFINLFDKITALHIEKSPQDEIQYKKIYLDVINKIKKETKS